MIEAPVDDTEQTLARDTIKLVSIQLSGNSPLLGKKVGNSGLSTRYQSLLVSMMRDEKYFTPDASTQFMTHDILWLVGNPEQLSSLK